MEKRIFKHILVLSLLAGLLLTAMANGQSAFDIRWGQQQTYSSSPANSLRQWAEGVDGRIGGVSLGTGTTYYLDSNVSSEGDGTSWASAKDTMTEAMALCTANNGDQIRVAQGHAQSGDAANFWGTVVAGVTVIHEGSGSDQGTWMFADTDTAINVGVANVTVIGGRYLAGISEVVSGFILDASADYFTLINAEIPEPTTSSWEFNVFVQYATGTNNLTISGCTQHTADETGADHFLNGGAGAVSGLTVIGNTLHGEYDIAAIFSDQADLETYIRYNQITQLTASQFGIEFTAAATGIVADNRVNATVLFEVDPGSMAYWQNMEGDTLPEEVSLTGQLGAFTGPAAGSAQDDNVKASLDLVHLVAESCTSTVLTTIVNGINDLFTISGTVKIIELVGIVTTVIESKSCLINYNVNPTIPAGDTVFGTDGTALEINADNPGVLYTWSGEIAADLIATDNGVFLGLPAPLDGNTKQLGALIVPAGSLELAAVVSTSATGAITFTIRYQPLTPGATIVSNSS